MRWRLMIPALLLATTMLQATAIADPYVTATYRPIDPGYRLEFVIYADPLRGFAEWGLFTTALTDLASPPNWQGGVGVRETVWYTSFPAYYVPPGGVLHGCAASVAEQPGPMDYYILQTGPGPASYYGTVAPTLVPEPFAVTTLGGGLAYLGGILLGRRRPGRSRGRLCRLSHR